MKNVIFFPYLYSVKTLNLFWILLFAFLDTHAQELLEAKCYGGKQQMRIFFNAEMVYPEKALQDKTEGTVVIYYVIDEKGNVFEKNIELSVSPELDREALRLFSKLLWHPAALYGNPVAIKQSFPLKFEIKKYNRVVKKRGYSDIKYLVEEIDTSNKIYNSDKIDRLPEPLFDEKGMKLRRFIAENTQYPETAFKQNINGTVKLQFVVEPSGNLSNCIIVENVGGGCNEEAKRVIRLLKWKPGIKNNMAVRTMIVFGITFGSDRDSSFEYFPTQHGSTMQ